jgi:hypothetical protein
MRKAEIELEILSSKSKENPSYKGYLNSQLQLIEYKKVPWYRKWLRKKSPAES